MKNIIRRKSGGESRPPVSARSVRTGEVSGVQAYEPRVQIKNVMAGAALFFCSAAANAKL